MTDKLPYIYEAKDGVLLKSNISIDEKEAEVYINHERKKYKIKPSWVECIINIKDDTVDIRSHFNNPPKFQRIRRITGYLVGTLDRFNDAKRAEESERIKHKIGE